MKIRRPTGLQGSNRDSSDLTVDSHGGHRILFVGINYAPEHSGIAPYTTAAAEHMAAVGNDVLVLTGVPRYPSWQVPESFRWQLRMEESSESLRVRRLRHYVPSRQSAVRRTVYEATFAAHVLAQRLPWRPDAVLAIVPSLLGAARPPRWHDGTELPFASGYSDLMGRAAVQSGIPGGKSVAHLASQLELHLLPSRSSRRNQ